MKSQPVNLKLFGVLQHQRGMIVRKTLWHLYRLNQTPSKPAFDHFYGLINLETSHNTKQKVFWNTYSRRTTRRPRHRRANSNLLVLSTSRNLLGKSNLLFSNRRRMYTSRNCFRTAILCNQYSVVHSILSMNWF